MQEVDIKLFKKPFDEYELVEHENGQWYWEASPSAPSSDVVYHMNGAAPTRREALESLIDSLASAFNSANVSATWH